MWYFFSTAISVWNKHLLGMTEEGLNMPLLLSSTHALVQYLLTLTFFRQKAAIVDQPTFIKNVMPCALAGAVEVGGANLSLVFISLSFYTMIKSSSPIFILLFAFAFGLEEPRVSLILIMLTICLGVAITVVGELQLNTMGLLLVLGATVASGFRWTITQILLQNSDFRNPIAVIRALAPIQFLSLLLFSLIVEGPIAQFANMPSVKDGLVAFASMAFGGVLAFCMTMAEFSLIKATSTVTLSVAGIAKELVLLLASAIAFHDVLTPLNILGLVVSLAGIIAYNRYRYLRNTKPKYQSLDMDDR